MYTCPVSLQDTFRQSISGRASADGSRYQGDHPNSRRIRDAFFTTQGRPNKQIAAFLGKTIGTVKNHEDNIRGKLSTDDFPVSDQIQTTILAIRSGLVPLRLVYHYFLNMNRLTLTGLYNSLTAREKEIFSLRTRGHLRKQIAQALNIKENTIKIHFTNILAKLKHVGGTHLFVILDYILNGVPPFLSLPEKKSIRETGDYR